MRGRERESGLCLENDAIFFDEKSNKHRLLTSKIRIDDTCARCCGSIFKLGSLIFLSFSERFRSLKSHFAPRCRGLFDQLDRNPVN